MWKCIEGLSSWRSLTNSILSKWPSQELLAPGIWTINTGQNKQVLVCVYNGKISILPKFCLILILHSFNFIYYCHCIGWPIIFSNWYTYIHTQKKILKSENFDTFYQWILFKTTIDWSVTASSVVKYVV